VTRPELWSIIDAIAVAHPPGGPLRLTNAELVSWLTHVSVSLLASRKIKQQAKKAARLVPKIIGPVYELPAPPHDWGSPAPPPGPRPPERSYQPSLFEGIE
jgi:hypothetical protein